MMTVATLLPRAAIPSLMSVEEYWDFVNLPENHDRHFELIEGKVIEMSRPSQFHGMICMEIGYLLRHWLGQQQQPGYIAMNDAGVILHEEPATVVGPDVAYYPLTEVPKKWAEVAPTLAVEVLSPNDKPSEVNTKLQEYLTSGTRLVWLIDPESRTVTIHRPDTEPRTLSAQDELSGGEELPEFSCQVADLFKMPTSA